DISELEEWYSQADVDNKDMGFFEVIEGPQRLYMDIDILGDGDYFDLVEEQCDRIREELDEAEIFIFDQSRPGKFSVHLLVTNYYCINNEVNKVFCESCRCIQGVDMQVYHHNQLFRLLGSYKASANSSKKRLVNAGEVSLRETMVSYVKNCYLYDTDIKPKKHNWKPFESRKVRTKMTNPQEICYSDISAEKLKLDLDNKVHLPSQGYLIPLTYNGGNLNVAVLQAQYSKFEDKRFNKEKVLILNNNNSLLAKTINTVKGFINNNVGSLAEFGVKTLANIVPVEEGKVFAKITSSSEFFNANSIHIDNVGKDVPARGAATFCIAIDGIFVRENYVSLQIKVVDMIVIKGVENFRRGPMIDVSKMN
ncbi:hypothetical protein IWW36_005246, partial [Coemansia brasiliensis]